MDGGVHIIIIMHDHNNYYIDIFLQRHMDTYFARVVNIIRKGGISPRIKFMLQDVQELRDNGWKPLRKVKQDPETRLTKLLYARTERSFS